jgi:hypothetical protein
MNWTRLIIQIARELGYHTSTADEGYTIYVQNETDVIGIFTRRVPEGYIRLLYTDGSKDHREHIIETSDPDVLDVIARYMQLYL